MNNLRYADDTTLMAEREEELEINFSSESDTTEAIKDARIAEEGEEMERCSAGGLRPRPIIMACTRRERSFLEA